jgi:hypothetical protein
MAFSDSAGVILFDKVDSGELWSDSFSITTDKFDPTILTGKFASYDAGILKTGIAGTLAGVICRDIAGSIDVDTIDAVHERTVTVKFVRSGVITVDVLTGNTPEFGGKVYTDTDGKATTDDQKTATNAEFIREVKTDVWLIRLI